MAELTTTLARTLLQGVRRRQGILRTRKSSALLWALAALSAGVILLPLIYLIVRVTGAESTVWDLIFRSSTLLTLIRTVWLALAVTVASAILAVPLAWLTVRTDLPFRRLWAVLTALPLVIPSYVGAYLMVASLGPRGMLAQWLEGIMGISRLPAVYGFPGALYVLTLLSYPYTLLSVQAALKGIDPSLEEASRGLGNNHWRTFFRVTLPQLRPALAAGSLLVALYVLRDFGAVSIMRYPTFTRVIYIQYQSAFDRTSAALLSLILVGLTFVILFFEVRTRGRARYYRGTTGGQHPARRVSLGAWRWPALLLCGGVVTISLIIPAGVLLYWLLRGWSAGQSLLPLWPALRNSTSASALAALATLLAAIPVAVVSVRRPGRPSLILERITYTGFALPGIVVALALVFFGTRYTLFFYQTLPLLILAYVTLFLPQAVGSVRASLLQIHPNLEEAARGLGHHPLNVFTKITFPLLRPGTAAAISLVFLTTMKELPATLILAPLGFKTLATAVWSAVSEAFFAQAAGPALLLILASSIPTALLVLRDPS
jgi:iron(III) transport system permease protein